MPWLAQEALATRTDDSPYHTRTEPYYRGDTGYPRRLVRFIAVGDLRHFKPVYEQTTDKFLPLYEFALWLTSSWRVRTTTQVTARMEVVLRNLVRRDPVFAQFLADTKYDIIVFEDTSSYWGRSEKTGLWTGKNEMGELFMKIRKDLTQSVLCSPVIPAREIPVPFVLRATPAASAYSTRPPSPYEPPRSLRRNPAASVRESHYAVPEGLSGRGAPILSIPSSARRSRMRSNYSTRPSTPVPVSAMKSRPPSYRHFRFGEEDEIRRDEETEAVQMPSVAPRRDVTFSPPFGVDAGAALAEEYHFPEVPQFPPGAPQPPPKAGYPSRDRMAASTSALPRNDRQYYTVDNDLLPPVHDSIKPASRSRPASPSRQAGLSRPPSPSLYGRGTSRSRPGSPVEFQVSRPPSPTHTCCCRTCNAKMPNRLPTPPPPPSQIPLSTHRCGEKRDFCRVGVSFGHQAGVGTGLHGQPRQRSRSFTQPGPSNHASSLLPCLRSAELRKEIWSELEQRLVMSELKDELLLELQRKLADALAMQTRSAPVSPTGRRYGLGRSFQL